MKDSDLAAKAVAQAAAAASGENPHRYVEKERPELIGALDHEVRVVVTAADSSGRSRSTAIRH